MEMRVLFGILVKLFPIQLGAGEYPPPNISIFWIFSTHIFFRNFPSYTQNLKTPPNIFRGDSAQFGQISQKNVSCQFLSV